MIVTRRPPCRVIRTPRFSIRWAGELLWTLAVHRVSIRYKETLFGFGWIFLQPLALTLIFNYIQRIAQIPTGKVPYPLFMATGLVAWSLTSLTVAQSSVSVAGSSPLLKRIRLPRILIPLSVILASLVDLLVMCLFLAGLFLYYRTFLPWGALWVVPIFIVHLLLLVGLGCLVSLANVYLRDIGQAIPSLLQLWFFASPVFYSSSMVPEEFVWIARWNPMTGLIEGYRSAILLGRAPSPEFFGPAAIVCVATFLIGVTSFLRLEVRISDLV